MSSVAQSDPTVSTANEEEAPASVSSTKETKEPKGGKKKKGKGKKKGKKGKALKLPKDMVTNERGEIVSTREYALEKTLEATSRSLRQTQERMELLVRTNELLNETCQQQEKDALEVIAALHQESEKKDLQIKDLRAKMEEQEQQARRSRDAVVEESERKVAEINSILNEKEAAFKVMQQEFSVIKDFRRKRHDLMKELEYQKLELNDTEKRHKDIITRLERKFFEEKIRLQKEANRKISELATKAHKEAVTNLKETTKEVYKENIRMAEALRYHVQEGEELSKANAELTESNRQLTEEKDLHNVIVKEKIMQSKQQEQEIKELRLKITSMEHSLSHVVREFEHEREIIGNLARRELDEVRSVADKLRASLARKTIEMKHIKRLAQHILDQRTELEQFFLDSLEFVKSEMRKNHEKAHKLAQANYNQKMRAIMLDKTAPVPPIQSFRLPLTNPRGESLAATLLQDAAQPSKFDGKAKVDIKDLAWEDKERVLRILFAKMNGTSLAKAADAADRVRAQLTTYRSGSMGSANGFARGMDREVDIDHPSDDEHGGGGFGSGFGGGFGDQQAAPGDQQHRQSQPLPEIAPQAEPNSQAGVQQQQQQQLASSLGASSGVSGTLSSSGFSAGLDQLSSSLPPLPNASQQQTDGLAGSQDQGSLGGSKPSGPAIPLFAINDIETDFSASVNNGMPQITIDAGSVE